MLEAIESYPKQAVSSLERVVRGDITFSYYVTLQIPLTSIVSTILLDFIT